MKKNWFYLLYINRSMFVRRLKKINLFFYVFFSIRWSYIMYFVRFIIHNNTINITLSINNWYFNARILYYIYIYVYTYDLNEYILSWKRIYEYYIKNIALRRSLLLVTSCTSLDRNLEKYTTIGGTTVWKTAEVIRFQFHSYRRFFFFFFSFYKTRVEKKSTPTIIHCIRLDNYV